MSYDAYINRKLSRIPATPEITWPWNSYKTS